MITGGSGGIGSAASRLFFEAGDTVYSLSRRGEDEGGIRHIACDVCDEGSVISAIAQVVEREGRIDVLVNNAGMGISGAVEFTDEAEAERLMAVNFMGAFLVSRYAMPHLRASKGVLVNVSSVAGYISVPFQAFYSASKAAVNSLTLALREEVRPFGVRVCAVMPGDVKTGFTASRQKSVKGAAVYGERIERAVSNMEKDEQSGMPPEKVARCIAKAAAKKSPRPLYTVGGKYRLFVLLAKFMPLRLISFVAGKLYG